MTEKNIVKIIYGIKSKYTTLALYFEKHNVFEGYKIWKENGYIPDIEIYCDTCQMSVTETDSTITFVSFHPTIIVDFKNQTVTDNSITYPITYKNAHSDILKYSDFYLIFEYSIFSRSIVGYKKSFVSNSDTPQEKKEIKSDSQKSKTVEDF